MFVSTFVVLNVSYSIDRRYHEIKNVIFLFSCKKCQFLTISNKKVIESVKRYIEYCKNMLYVYKSRSKIIFLKRSLRFIKNQGCILKLKLNSFVYNSKWDMFLFLYKIQFLNNQYTSDFKIRYITQSARNKLNLKKYFFRKS